MNLLPWLILQDLKQCLHLPNTLRLKLLLLSPAVLEAKHVYLPVCDTWAFVIWRNRPPDIRWWVSSSLRSWPSLCHVISGTGFPVTKRHFWELANYHIYNWQIKGCILNSAAMNTGVHVIFSNYGFLWIILQYKIKK